MSTTAWRLRQRSLELLYRLVRVTNLVLRLNSGISSRNQTPLFAQADLAADSAWPASYRESASVRSFAGAAPSTGWVANDLPFRAEPASGIVRGRSPGRRQGGLRRDRRSDRDWGARWTMPEPTREKDKDKSAKWLIEHHGDAILRLGGVTDLVRWKAAPAELVLPAKLPDGLIFAWRAGRDHPEPFVVEIATYPELRAAERHYATCCWSTSFAARSPTFSSWCSGSLGSGSLGSGSGSLGS